MNTTTTDWTALLRERFAFESLRPGQEDVLKALESGGRAVAVFPTGAGKSICYQLPALVFDGLTLVISPLIALMKDQIDFLKRKGIEAGRLDSSLTFDEARTVQSKIDNGTLKLLYVSPERFKNERFLEMISQQKIALFAVDEAHCISEWGHNFRPDYLKLAETARQLKAERVLALTATATPEVARDICAALEIPSEAAIITGFYRPNLKLAITPVDARERAALIVKRLQARAPGPTIVYVTLQNSANVLAEKLYDAGFSADAYHAGLEADERSRIQEKWMASDRGIVVATIAFGMGIDKADVRYVYHYNLPKSIESYSQEIGRAGRDGLDSVVEMFACAEDIPTLENFVYGDTPIDEAVRSLVEDVMSRGDQFDLSMYDLSARHDMRLLVLKTALTYLELQGALREGAPFYAGYKYTLQKSAPAILNGFDEERSRFIQSIFNCAQMGRKWYTLNPDDATARIGQPRQRIVKALDYLHEKGLIALEASEVRNRFTRLSNSKNPNELATVIINRFADRERKEIDRVAQLLKLVEEDTCQTNALARYFGEERSTPCNNCIPCLTGSGKKMPATDPPSLPGTVDPAKIQTLRKQHPTALGHPRQMARYLCGLSSPALTKAKLTKHELFAAWEDRRFPVVLEWLAKH